MTDIIWLNGPFGAGKTTTSTVLARRLGGTVVDPEAVGYLLRPVLAGPRPVRDFQDWPAWRALVPAFLHAVHTDLGGPLIVPQTVIVEPYWVDIDTALRDRGLSVLAVTLDVEPREHERRIRTDRKERRARQWRRERAADFRAALPWLAQRTVVIDTSAMTVDEVASRVVERVHSSG